MFDDENLIVCSKMLYYHFTLKALFQSAQHLNEKREGSRSGTGSKPLTNGSGSGRPKNLWIQLIRIRIRNTGFKYKML
jgi:hypothetical protein